MVMGGRPISFSSPTEALRAGIATVFQEGSLVPNLTVAANLLLGREPVSGGWFGPIHRQRLRELAEAAIEQSGFVLNPDDLVADLTSAGRQLVELTRALSLAARVVVLDEPTSALTAEETAGLFSGAPPDCRRHCCGLHHPSTGRSGADLRSPAGASRRAACRELPGRAAQRDIVRMMVGRDVATLFPLKSGRAGRHQPILKVEAVQIGSIGPIDLELGAGEVLGLVGLLGSVRKASGALFSG